MVASLDKQDASRQTQSDFPHLVVVSDPEKKLSDAFKVLDPAPITPDNVEANAPTTFLIDGNGMVRWLFRPNRYLERLNPDQLLAAVDQHISPN